MQDMSPQDVPDSDPARLPRSDDRAPARRLLVAALVAAAIPLTLGACGGASGSGEADASAGDGGGGGYAGNGPPRAGRRGFAQSAKVRSCLKKRGVTLSSPGANRPPGARAAPPGGPPPPGAQPPSGGKPPQGGRRDGRGAPPRGDGQRPGRPGRPRRPGRGPGGARFKKLRAALKKCGAQMPGGKGGEHPPGRHRDRPGPEALGLNDRRHADHGHLGHRGLPGGRPEGFRAGTPPGG